jgi:hypothetical protein
VSLVVDYEIYDDYKDVVANPMYLTHIIQRLKATQYSSFLVNYPLSSKVCQVEGLLFCGVYEVQFTLGAGRALR